MTKNKLSELKSFFDTVKSESNELFRETEVYLNALDEKAKLEKSRDFVFLYVGDVPKSNSRTSIVRRIITLRDDLNRLSQILKEG